MVTKGKRKGVKKDSSFKSVIEPKVWDVRQW